MMGMGEAAFERYLASMFTNQIGMIQSCVEQLQTEVELADPVPEACAIYKDGVD
jgi:hypothetical protein